MTKAEVDIEAQYDDHAARRSLKAAIKSHHLAQGEKRIALEYRRGRG